MQSINIKSGVNLHYLQTRKFKTTTLGIYFHRPLRREEATVNALLANVLRRGCPLYPDTLSLSRALDQLYGARLLSGVRKKGDSQILSVNFEFANESYLGDSGSVLENILSLAQSLVLEQRAFSPAYVSQEKENLKRQIQAQINDKRSYVITRCTQIMCKGEPYGIHELGFYEDVDAITEERLWEQYQEVLLKSPVDIFICGDVDIFWAEQHIKQMFAPVEPATDKYPGSVVVKDVGEVKRVTEEEQIAQGKLSIGFRTKLQPVDARYPALLIFNAVFGSGPSSKLFNNVREKLSLAYYAMSRLDMYKGVMTVNSGIEVKNYQLAYDEIFRQLDAVKNGDITPGELSAAILGTVNNIRSLQDSAAAMEDYWLGRLIAGSKQGFEELISLVSKVGVEQIVDVAGDVELDTVYFLKGV